MGAHKMTLEEATRSYIRFRKELDLEPYRSSLIWKDYVNDLDECFRGAITMRVADLLFEAEVIE